MAVKTMAMFRASHGVPDFEVWFEAFLAAEEAGLHAGLGVVQSIVSKLEESDEDGNPVVQVIHILPADRVEDAKMQWDMNGPPFVGGPDLIKNGAIIAPIVVEYSVLRCNLGAPTVSVASLLDIYLRSLDADDATFDAAFEALFHHDLVVMMPEIVGGGEHKREAYKKLVNARRAEGLSVSDFSCVEETSDTITYAATVHLPGVDTPLRVTNKGHIRRGKLVHVQRA